MKYLKQFATLSLNLSFLIIIQLYLIYNFKDINYYQLDLVEMKLIILFVNYFKIFILLTITDYFYMY